MRTLLLFSALLFSLSSNGQIKIAEQTRVQPVLHNNVAYDSTVDNVGDNYQLLQGQDIFIIPPSGIFRNSYYGFYTNRECIPEYEYHPEDVDERYRTPMRYLKGRTFTVTDILPYEHLALHQEKVLEIKDKDNGEILYYSYRTDNSEILPFIIVGYYEKLKKDFMGKVLIANGKATMATDMETKLAVNNPKGKQWKCVDVVGLDGEIFRYALVLKNKSETISYSIAAHHDNDIYNWYNPYTEVYQAATDLLRDEFGKWDDQTKRAGIGIMDVRSVITDRTAGIEFKLVNRRPKEIKYIFVTLAARNRVNDVILRKELQGIGPVKQDDMELFKFTKDLQVKMADKVDIEAIRVQFFDGTTLTVKGQSAIAGIHFPYDLDDVTSKSMMLD